MKLSPWKAPLWYILLTILTDFSVWFYQVRPTHMYQLDSFRLAVPRIIFAGLLGCLAPWLFARSAAKPVALPIGVLSIGVLGSAAEAFGRWAQNRDREFLLIDSLVSAALWTATSLVAALILSIGAKPHSATDRTS